MAARIGSWAAPLFLLACLLMGGSRQGYWTNLVLQLAAIALIAWALIAGRSPEGRAPARLRAIGLLALLLILLQLVPLPPSIWSSLPGREPVVQGFALLGEPLPWMPISLAPEQTLSGLLATLPAAAMLVLVLRRPKDRPGRLAAVTIVAMCLSVLVGILQVTQGDRWYPYPVSSLGAATGLFANSNHLASLLLASIPLMAALVATRLRGKGLSGLPAGNRFLEWAALGLGAAVLLAGAILNGSFAILLLGGPMIAASALIFLPAARVRLARLALLLALATAAGLALLVAMGSDRFAGYAGQASIAERQQIWQSSAHLAVDYAPAGSGFGTFPLVYRLGEDPDLVKQVYVNHAHNDLLELAVELGLAGMAVLALFLLWWTWRFIAIWRSGTAPPIVRAATLVTLGLMLHSLVDFPLRPTALSALFAACVGLMAMPRPSLAATQSGRPRHLRLEDLGG